MKCARRSSNCFSCPATIFVRPVRKAAIAAAHHKNLTKYTQSGVSNVISGAMRIAVTIESCKKVPNLPIKTGSIRMREVRK